MPLRDHFAAADDDRSWGPVHGAWPTIMAIHLNRILPDQFVARPMIQIGSMEIDLAGLERSEGKRTSFETNGTQLAWSPSEPALLLEDEYPTADDFEMLVYQNEKPLKLVAALELVSPSNKDRLVNREQFVSKCETHLRNGVSVAIIDIVTNRHVNLYGELQDALDAKRTEVSEAPLYAISCRGLRTGTRRRLEAWEHELGIDERLPTIPLWLTDTFHIPLDLEATYEETCKSLRIQ